MEGTGEFGEKMNSMPKFVVSKTLQSATGRTGPCSSGDLADEVAQLKERYEGTSSSPAARSSFRGYSPAALSTSCS